MQPWLLARQATPGSGIKFTSCAVHAPCPDLAPAGLPAYRATLGRQARAYADAHFASTTVLAALERQMVAVATAPAPPKAARGELL